MQVTCLKVAAVRDPASPEPRQARGWIPAYRLSASACSARSAGAIARPQGLVANLSHGVRASRTALATHREPLRLFGGEYCQGHAQSVALPTIIFIRHMRIALGPMENGFSIRTRGVLLSVPPFLPTGSGPNRTSPAPSPAPTSCARRMVVRTRRRACSAGSASCAPWSEQRADHRKAAMAWPRRTREACCVASPATSIWGGRAAVKFYDMARRRVG